MTLSTEELSYMGDLFNFKSYHNTTEESSETLVNCETKARKQERRVLECFPAGQYLSQPAIRREYYRRFGEELMIASCSRAVANLTTQGKLEKTDVKVAGDFGRPVFCWIKK